MPRRLRISIPNMPHHLIHRGHRQQNIFFSDGDRTDYLGTLAECRALFGIKVFAYCLMTNHVHLILDPGAEPANLSWTMKRLAGRHSRRLNAAHGWRGTMWEGRFKCSLIDSDRYLLTCGRYVDQNPVRARMVSTPDAYSWSSFRARAGILSSPLLDSDPALDALSSSPESRARVYRILAGTPLADDELEFIRESTQRNRALGDDAFVETIRTKTGCDISVQNQGRPKTRR
jgi:putative transposase